MLSLRSLYVFIICLLICKLIAQCPIQNLLFSSQSQIDSFPIKYPNCKNLGPIGFSIRESEPGNITNLLPFQQITGTFLNEISLENLIIDQTLHLENIIKYPNHFLSAFHHLDSIDVLGLVNLDSLYNLNGLEKIRDLSGLRLSGNVNLNNMDTLAFAIIDIRKLLKLQ